MLLHNLPGLRFPAGGRGKGLMEFISKNITKKSVVWLKELNRYIIFQQPAFEIFQQLANDTEINEIANHFSKKHNISFSEALEFINDINNNLKQIEGNINTDFPKRECIDIPDFSTSENFTTITYEIFNKIIRFSYSSLWMKDMIHTGISHLQTKSNLSSAYHFQLFNTENELVLIVNNDQFFRWPTNQTEYFKGSVTLQLLNAIYCKNEEQWMGIFHAGAVSKNNNSVLFSAPSGFGKSTLSALLVANGFSLISDDFVPITLNNQELYSVPSGISVKPGAIKTLIHKFPELKEIATQINTSTGKEVASLVPSLSRTPEKAKVKAIIFPEYNPSIEFQWDKVDNTTVLNNLLTESWIADNDAAVSTFLDWFFELPCYRLKYNNNEKAIEKIGQLLV